MNQDNDVILYDTLEDINEACLYPADTFPDLVGNPNRFELVIQRIGYMASKALDRYEKSRTSKKSS